MPNVAINITGPSYESRSRALSNQKTQNLYPELVDTVSGKNKYVLHSWPGCTSFGSETGVDRGMFEFQGALYKVTGTTLYSVDSSGTHTALGTIPGSARCIMEGISIDLIIVSEGSAYYLSIDPILADFSMASEVVDITSFDADFRSVMVSSDGTKAYFAGAGSDKIYELTLTSLFDITTASDAGVSFDISSQPAPADLIIRSDGLKIYNLSASGFIYEYDLTTAWDLSTAAYNSVSVAFDEISASSSFSFSSDGIKVFVISASNNSVYEYKMDSAWDITKIKWTGQSLDFTSQETDANSLTFNETGTKMYMAGSANNTIYEYDLTTAWDLSTASYNSSSLATGAGYVRSILYAPNNALIYIVDLTSDVVRQATAFSEITDTDLETPNAVAHLNNQAIYDGDNARWCSSDVGDATSINALNYATAESSPDNLLRPYVFNQTLYLMGEKTIETWYNSGVGNPPFDRIEGGIIPVGLAAIHSVTHNDNFLYFLGDDRKVYRVFGYNKENISTTALSHAIEGYTTISDAVGLAYSFENHNFYQLSFPTEEKTWCYSEQTGIWFELSSEDSRYLAGSHAYAYGKNLIADYRDGNIYELDINAFDENGTTVKRIRQTGPIHGEALGAPGKWIEMNRFELIMETGVGLSAGQGSDPVVMLSFSDDGGKSFSTEMWGNIGKLEGDYIKVEWHALGGFYSRIIRIAMSDPVLYSIHSANADIEVGI